MVFVDVPLKDWKYTPGEKVVPIILPRTYINMYNFGFAQSHSLPKISDGLMGMIDFNICIQGWWQERTVQGKGHWILLPSQYDSRATGVYGLEQPGVCA